MIEVIFKSVDEHVVTKLHQENLKQKEVALLIYALEQLKLKLLDISFSGDVSVYEK